MVYFPGFVHADAGLYADSYFGHLADAAATVDRDALNRAGEILATAARGGKFLFSCGNGGSAAIANHLVCDCLKGVRTGSTLRPKVHSLSTNVETITAIGNDIGYDEIFAFQLESLGSEGDVLVAISSSGASPNIIKALAEAKRRGMATIAMTGFSGGEAALAADVALHVSATNYGVVEDVHQALMHILAQYLRHSHQSDPSVLGAVKF